MNSKPEPPNRNGAKLPRRGFMYAVAGVALVSTNFVTAKYGVSEGGFNAESFSTVWTGSAALYALIILLVFGGREEILGIPRSAPVKTLLLGGLTAAGMILTWAGLQKLDPSFCAFLWRFMPVLVLLFGALFLGERIRYVELVPLVLMVAGGAYAAMGRWEIVGVGVIFTLVAAVSGALQWVVAKLLVDRHKPDGVVFHRLASAAGFIVLWTVLSGRMDLRVPVRFWVVTLVGALLGPVLAHVLTFRAYRHWGMSRSGMVLAVQPLFVLPMAFVFLGKIPAGKELAGGVLILVGAFWLAWMNLGGSKGGMEE